MGTASSSAARLTDVESDDLVSGLEPANDAYGSLAALATRPKPKKKPVLVLDADELAEAHLMFQQDAALQLEDAEHVERAPMTLGLAPLGSDAATDDSLDPDDDDYTVEADAPEPDKVLGLTRAEPREEADEAAPVARKKMVQLPELGDPAFDDILPFEPLAPVDEEPADEEMVDDEPAEEQPGDEQLADADDQDVGSPADEPLSELYDPDPEAELPAETNETEPDDVAMEGALEEEAPVPLAPTLDDMPAAEPQIAPEPERA